MTKLMTRRHRVSAPSLGDADRRFAGSKATNMMRSVVAMAIMTGALFGAPALSAQAATGTATFTSSCFAPYQQFSVNGAITGTPGQRVKWAVHSQNLKTGAWRSDTTFQTGQVLALPSSFGGTNVFNVPISGSRWSYVNGPIKVWIEVRWHDAASGTWGPSKYFAPNYPYWAPYRQYLYGIFHGNSISCVT